MNRIEKTFARLREERRAAFMPFITAGDPDLDATADLVRELDRRGADLIELGVPYSDPVADGPTIQASYVRALAGGIRTGDVFDTVAAVRDEVRAPIVTMISMSLVFRMGFERFIERARAAGVDGAIVPDLPVEEAAEPARLAADADFPLVLLSAPTTPPERRRLIAETSRGFIYCVSVTGITGARDHLPREVADHVRTLKELTDTPVCVGFGVSRAEQVRRLAGVADGVIVGSAIVRLIEAHSGAPREELLRVVGDFAAGLAAAAG